MSHQISQTLSAEFTYKLFIYNQQLSVYFPVYQRKISSQDGQYTMVKFFLYNKFVYSTAINSL